MDKHVSTLNCVGKKYKNLIIKMETNCNLLELAKANLKNLYDIVTILGLACIYFHVGIC
jgi:hypothetical protein